VEKALEWLQEDPGAGYAEAVDAIGRHLDEVTRSALTELGAEVRRRCLARGVRP
jgi:hypothetical protein